MKEQIRYLCCFFVEIFFQAAARENKDTANPHTKVAGVASNGDSIPANT